MALYDPREFPEAETVSPDFTLEEFLAWVRTKPAGEEYNFVCADVCAVAQFGDATGRESLLGLDPDQLDALHPGLCDLVNPLDFEFTFGALAARIEAELAR
jgi:hypothetical protein